MYCDTMTLSMTLSMTFRLVSSPCKFDSPSEPVGNPLARGPQKPEAWLLKYGLCFKISSRQLQTWSALQSDSRRIAEFSSIFINFPFVHWVRWALRHYATTLRRNASTPWSVARALTSTDTLHHSATAPVLQVAVLHQSKASKALRKALRITAVSKRSKIDLRYLHRSTQNVNVASAWRGLSVTKACQISGWNLEKVTRIKFGGSNIHYVELDVDGSWNWKKWLMTESKKMQVPGPLSGRQEPLCIFTRKHLQPGTVSSG